MNTMRKLLPSLLLAGLASCPYKDRAEDESTFSIRMPEATQAPVAPPAAKPKAGPRAKTAPGDDSARKEFTLPPAEERVVQDEDSRPSRKRAQPVYEPQETAVDDGYEAPPEGEAPSDDAPAKEEGGEQMAGEGEAGQ